MTDYPKADEQFIMGLRNWCQSTLAVSDDPTSCPLPPRNFLNTPSLTSSSPALWIFQLKTRRTCAST